MKFNIYIYIYIMKRIRLPSPPASPRAIGGVPDIFADEAYGVIRRAVIIGNGFPSSENQSIGLVRALGFSDKYTLYRVTRPSGGINKCLHWLPVSVHKKLYAIICWLYSSSRFLFNRSGKNPMPRFMGSSGATGLSSILEADVNSIVTMACDNFEKQGPLLVVASGRDTVSIASSIRRLASDNVFVVQIQHPRSRLERFDLVITPQHDYYPLTPHGQEQVPRFLRKWITPQEPPDRHVVLTVGALHQIDTSALRNAANAWHNVFAPLPKPLVVVNIGGPKRYCPYGVDLAMQLVSSLQSVLASCGTLRISFSSQTPVKISNIVVKELGTHPKVHIWNGEGPNPHVGHLAWADAFIITPESVSMLSEACSTGKPVYVVGAERCRWKFLEFHKKLRERGMVRPFTGLEDMSETWSYPPLHDTAMAASQVRKALAERGWRLQS